MVNEKSTPEDMPILTLDLSNTQRFDPSHFLDNPESVAAFLAEVIKEIRGETSSN